MLEKLVDKLLIKIRNEMPEVDDERAEVIKYGLLLIIGEVPKIILLFIIAYMFGLFRYVLFTFITIMPYRVCTGGFHLKTHIGCIIATTIYYVGNPKMSMIIQIPTFKLKAIIIFITYCLSIILIKKYAPADTVEFPILTQYERNHKKILSYVMLTILLLSSLLISNSVLSNILLFGVIIQTFSITKFAYSLTNNEYGFDYYNKVSDG